MSLKLFITGTDTDVGKTYVTKGILNAFKKNKYTTLGLKPIASGCILDNGILRNPDALLLQQASTIQLPYDQINPFAFEPAIAPHIAAKQQNLVLNVQELKQKTQYALQFPADICLVEGAGGWYVPLNPNETMADYVKAIQMKVLLVVGIRLGCINHALLTYKAMQEDNVSVLGWIANCIASDMLARSENIMTLQEWLPVPCLGIVDYQGAVETAIDLSVII